MAHVRRALGWVHSNPRGKKTAAGMPKFLYGWVSREQNSGRRVPPSNGHAAPAHPGLCAFHLSVRNANVPAQVIDPQCSECRHVSARRNPRPASEPLPFGGPNGGPK